MTEDTLVREDILLREDEGAIATLTLNNPGKLNALSEAMLATLQAALDDIAASRSVRVVILRAAGKAFCAGHDLREMTAARQAPDGGLAYFETLFATCGRMMTSIVKLPQPVIAEVHGIATAAGCQLVASCDLAVAASYHVDAANPVRALADIVGGWTSVMPLLPGEAAMLLDLVAMRMVTTVALASWRAARYPENAAYILRNLPASSAGLAALTALGRGRDWRDLA